MGRRSTVQRLANSCGIDAEELLLLLWDSGVEVDDLRATLTPQQLRGARQALRGAELHRQSVMKQVELPAEDAPAPIWEVLPYEPRESLSATDVENVHDELTRAFAGTDDAVDPPGIRDLGALESALARPETGQEFGERKYGPIQLAAAALLHSIVNNHAFYNGNKRTGLVSYVWFLRLNGYYLLFQEDALYECVVAVASHTLVSGDVPSWARADAEVLEIYDWTKQFTRAPQYGDRLIDWRRLERLLRDLGATIGTPRSNRIEVMLGDRRTLVTVPRRGAQIKPNAVAKIRSDLELDEAHGCDSDVFYSGSQRPKDAASLIRRYASVLTRLSQYDRGDVLVKSDHHDWSRNHR